MSENELEIALKNALAKGEASNPAFRQRVYRAAVDALERTLATQPDADAEHIADQKRRLAEAIRAAEAAYRKPAPQPQKSAPAAPGSAGQVSPEVRPEPRATTSGPEVALRAEPREQAPRSAAPDGEARIDAPQRGDRQQTRRRAPFARFLAGTVVLALVVIGAWWIITTGAFQSAAERDTSVPNPPLELGKRELPGRT